MFDQGLFEVLVTFWNNLSQCTTICNFNKTKAAAVKNTHIASLTVIDTLPSEKQTVFCFLIGWGNCVGLPVKIQYSVVFIATVLAKVK